MAASRERASLSEEDLFPIQGEQVLLLTRGVPPLSSSFSRTLALLLDGSTGADSP